MHIQFAYNILTFGNLIWIICGMFGVKMLECYLPINIIKYVKMSKPIQNCYFSNVIVIIIIIITLRD